MAAAPTVEKEGNATGRLEFDNLNLDARIAGVFNPLL